MITENEYLEVIKEHINDIINDFDKKDVESFKENFETLKNIIETYPGKTATLYPYLNNIFQFIYDSYQKDPSELNSKLLNITGTYIGEIFEFWKDYRSAVHAYSYSFFADGDLQSITKLLTVQILQLIMRDRTLPENIFQIISDLINEFDEQHKGKNFSINGNQITREEALETLKLFTNLSKFILERTMPDITPEDKKFITNRIKFTIKELLQKGVKLYFVIKNLEQLYQIYP
ncbi:MAG: hypothetical protein ACTSPQ_09540 [Candidatus Helarchaeota archaeon]